LVFRLHCCFNNFYSFTYALCNLFQKETLRGCSEFYTCDKIQPVLTHPTDSHRRTLMHSYSQLYLPRLQSYQIELLERLELLVNIDSGTGQLEGINSIISCLQQWFSDIGFATALHNSTLYGNNLVARRTGKGHLRLLLVGHVDTVYPQGAAAAQPFHINDGVAYGPGVIDMKSGD